MTEQEPSEALTLLRLAAFEFVAILVLVCPIELALRGGTPSKDLDQLTLTAISAIAAPIVDVVRTAIRWRRPDGIALRTAVRHAIAVGRLPRDADPDTWTRPLVDRQRAVRNAPLTFSVGIAVVLVVAVAALPSRMGHPDPIVIAALAIELTALTVALVLAVRDRTGRRAQVIAELLSELDASADSAAPIARMQLN